MSQHPAIRVLVVEDSAALRSLVVTVLELEGCEVRQAGDAVLAAAVLEAFDPEVVVLDIGLPGIDGLQLLAELRRSRDTGVILLTGRDGEPDRVLGLDLGADDYVVKPFLPSELAARVRSVWRRRSGAGASRLLRFEGLGVDLDQRTVAVGGEPAHLPRREFDLLARLVSAPRRVLSREDLLRDVWAQPPSPSGSRTVNEHVRRLRARIEADPGQPRWIRSVRGAGYYFDPGGGCATLGPVTVPPAPLAPTGRPGRRG